MVVLPIASCFIVLCLGLCILHALPTGGNTLGFSAELIHRDSPDSPLYDPTSTPFSRFHAAIHRSTGRANYFRNVTIFANSHPLNTGNSYLIYSNITSYSGQYVMTLDIGKDKENQLQQTHVLIDTGGDLTWVLCKPCRKCYEHKDPIFRPKASITYKKIGCKSDACTIHKGRCYFKYQPCRYNATYMDGLSISGILSKETLTFLDSSDRNERLVSVPGILFGCTHKTANSIPNEPGIGSVGLNDNSLSLIRQLKPVIGSSKFSYCLPVDDNKSSRINFGSAADVPDNLAMTTPLFIGSHDKFYYLHMTNIIVFDPRTKPLNFAMKEENNRHRQDGKIMIDSGTPLTFIPQVYMYGLVNKVIELIPNPRVEVPDDLAKVIDLCFDWREPIEEENMPKFFIYFAGDVNLEITKPFELLRENILCLTIASSHHTKGHQIFGSRAHSGYRTVYDLDAGQLTFLWEGC